MITIPTEDLLIVLGVDAVLLMIAVGIALDRARRFHR